MVVMPFNCLPLINIASFFESTRGYFFFFFKINYFKMLLTNERAVDQESTILLIPVLSSTQPVYLIILI